MFQWTLAMFMGVCEMELMWIHKCLITWLAVQDFFYSALNSSAWILGLLLKLGHCGTAQGHDWAGAFFRPIDFFFSCWCTWNETPIIKLHCQIKTICRDLPIVRQSELIFPLWLSAHEGSNFLSSQSSCANNFCFVSTLTLKWNNLQKTLGGLFWHSPQQMMVD